MTHYRIAEQGMGGSLLPPGHPSHTHRIHGFTSNKSRKVIGIYPLEAALNPDPAPDFSPEIITAARGLLDGANLVMSDLWVRHVYGYFHDLAVPTSGSLDLVDAAPYTIGVSPNRHRAAVHIREYFPHHEPRLDLIADHSYCYGNHPCTSCGKRVQYEAHLDALSHTVTGMDSRSITTWAYDPICPAAPDGRHRWPSA